MTEPASSVSAVPSEIFAGVALLILSFVVLLILRYYLPLLTTPAYLLVPVFFALWLPAGIVLLVPIDLALSTKTDDGPPRFLLVSWRITYWLTFALTWFILPILAEYSDSGYREPKDKVLYSLRENAQYHALVFGSGILGLIYVFISYGASFTSLKGLVMALAYCWGLVLAIYLMGHGLVAIPRRLFRNASISGRLRRIQGQAPALYEKMEDAETNLEDLEIQVSELSRRKVGSAKDFQDWIEELVDMTNMPESQPRSALPRGLRDENRILPTVITEKYMADLTRQLVRARHARSRYANEWNRLLRAAVETQAILDSAASKKLDFGGASPHAGFWDRVTLLSPYTRYLFYYHLVPYTKIFLGSFLAIASACIIWSEMVKVAQPALSIIRYTVVHHWTGDEGRVGFFGEVTAALWILYMCAAALTSVTEVKVWRGRALVRRNTAHESAFWYASQVARLSIPLSYNFITFLSKDVYKKTEFYDFLGQFIDLTRPGKWFDYLFPVFILVPVSATLFGLYGKVKRLFGFGDIVDDDEEGNETGYGTGSWREGRDLIERELNGTSVRGRRAAALGRTASPANGGQPRTARVAPVLSIPAARRVDATSSPLADSPTRPVANTSARRVGPTSTSRAAIPDTDPSDENFFQSLGHRMKNTMDTFDTPKWLQGIGQGIKKPKWMGSNDEAGGSGSRSGPPGRDNSDVRRWFGGGEGRIRL